MEKSLFRWKLVTLGLAVLVIIFAGILSQIYKDIEKNTINIYNTSFLPSLLKSTKQLETTLEIKNFLIGLNSTTEVKFQKAEILYSGNDIHANQVRDIIAGK